MSWDSYRKLADDAEVNTDGADYKWHETNMPLLHSGFLEQTPGKKPKCRLVLTVMYTRSKYVMKLTDRVSHKVAWIESPELNNMFEWLEDEIRAGAINWETEDWNSSNGSSFS